MNKQIIWVYTLCYNESHFVGNFLESYKEADRIIVYDNFSTDNSVELLKADPRVEIRQYDSGNQIRDDLYLNIKNNCWKEARGKADWVIIVDFDEIFTRMEHDVFEATFDLDLSIPYNEGCTIIKPYGYNMISWDAPLYTKDHPFTHSQKGTYHEPAEKLCCFRPDKITEINYEVGAHTAKPVGDVKIFYTKDYILLHFKAWNFDLYMERGMLYKERLSSINKDHGWGFQYMDEMEALENMYRAGMNLRRNILDLI